jgi:hypothetical protein
MLDCMDSYGLEPNATLWHFVHPTWFEDCGGWTKEENIPAWVDYCERMFRWVDYLAGLGRVAGWLAACGSRGSQCSIPPGRATAGSLLASRRASP